ncbi:MAG: N-acetylmuramoyl-L-alanine amidase [Eggerthellaceae bacterium]|nr:N-acetylmuramoyl-L-alanine amidase [Eggerthellaceae bacterium]
MITLVLALMVPVSSLSTAFADEQDALGNGTTQNQPNQSNESSFEDSGALGSDGGEETGFSEASEPAISEEDFDAVSIDPDEGWENATFVDPAEVIEYVYLDEKVVVFDQEQYIAFALIDEEVTITEAEISLIAIDTEEITTYAATTVLENTALFSFAFPEIEGATNYRLTEIAYCLEESEEIYRADFSAPTTDNNDYSFDVVSQQVAEAVLAIQEQEEDLAAFAIADDGEFIVAETVEEALLIADGEGIENFEAGESIVDATALSIMAEQGNPIDPDEGKSSWLDSLRLFFAPLNAYAAATSAREAYLIVALDPGHGAGDSGAVGKKLGSGGKDLLEKDVNWKIAQACYNELLVYTGVSPVLTRKENENPSLATRVQRAVSNGADVFVSLHNNASGTGKAMGAEVWVPNNAKYLNSQTHTVGEQLGKKILAQLTSLGLTNRGVKTRDNTTNEKYPDGSLADYYTVINEARRAGIPGIIVEHAFVDNASDAAKLKDDNFLKKLGQADATGIALQYNLGTHKTAQKNALVKYRSYVANLGWQGYVYDQKVSGTTGKSKRIEAFEIQLQNQPTTGSIQYKAHVAGVGWQGWVDSAKTAGTTGQAKATEAIQIKLTGDMANKYDIYYRVHSANIGWLGWAKNGASAGSVGYGYSAEAFEVVIVKRGASAPGSTTTPFRDKGVVSTTISYQSHVQNVGWQPAVSEGKTSGTTGKSLRVEALKISLPTKQYAGSIQYNAHCANLGWQGWKNEGAQAGTTGQSRQVEAVQIRLTGDMASKYDIYYRVHAANFGWLSWAKNGETAGSMGYGYRMEAFEIKLVAKGGKAPGSTTGPFRQKALVHYQTHVQNVGWQSWASDGETTGTTGRSLRVEALKIGLVTQQYSGGIQYSAHCANIGWQGWKTGPTLAGTTGQSRQVEAIKIKLTGEMATYFDVYYRVHAANFGWLGWAKNGASAGTAGYGYRLEALQIKLVLKGNAAPGSTSGAYREKVSSPSTSSTPIMGSAKTSIAQMVRRYEATGHKYPATTYASKGASTLKDFCTIVYEEARAEGVRPEVLFCQAMYETGWLQFGGSVKASQCNFGGLGATTPTTGGATFTTVRLGLRAQTQHLKAYAVSGLKASDLKNPLVDPRFDYVTKGSAKTLEALNGKWAVPGTGYGEKLSGMIDVLLKA